jgi:hypothetical protein
MLEFLIDNICVMFGGRVFRSSVKGREVKCCNAIAGESSGISLKRQEISKSTKYCRFKIL